MMYVMMYETKYDSDLNRITDWINNMADRGWVLHTFTASFNSLTHYVAVMEKSEETV